VACMGGSRGTHGVSAMRPEGKRQHGRSRRRWEDSIKVYFEEEGWEGMDRDRG
jgi:hypothetical protein